MLEINKINFSEEEIESIINMYVNKLMSPKKIGKYFSCGESTIVRILKSRNIVTRNKNNKITTYTFNKNYFDIIDSEEKAYWIGFIWCDGYVCKRNRRNAPSYEFKLGLSERDIEHLAKLKICLDSTHPIKIYPNKTKFESKYDEARLFIANNYFGSILYSEYGMIPNRVYSNNLVSKIPNKLAKHFIRGIVDAEGSIVHSWTHDKSKDYYSFKDAVNISTYKTLIDYIQNFLYENNIINAKSKLYKRHIDRDKECVAVKYCGKINALRLLDYLYGDATIYLQRKYDKYIEIKNYKK